MRTRTDRAGNTPEPAEADGDSNPEHLFPLKKKKKIKFDFFVIVGWVSFQVVFVLSCGQFGKNHAAHWIL